MRTQQSRPRALVSYPPPRSHGAPRDYRQLDTMLRDAARQLRASCTAQPDARTAQQFTDCTKGRSLGTLALAKMLWGARLAGATPIAALQFARAVEAFTLALYGDDSLCIRAALLLETTSQGNADVAQILALTSGGVGDLDRAIEHTAAQITHGQQLLAALTRRRGELT